ncbi:hypothetical protein AAIB33_02170 [Microbacterium sp. AZCO]|uniref:hypothetical protein n=1 Tax=Microbacterium sp. AZCO TaxID=3142976 RepID=UPI0031F34033
MTTTTPERPTTALTAAGGPSRSALATRSLRAAERLREQGRSDEYRAALAQHFAEFVAPSRRACPVRLA